MTPGTPPRAGRRHAPDSVLVAIGLTVVTLIVLGVTVAMETLNFDVVIGILTALFLGVVTIPLLRYVARKEGDISLVTIMYWGLAAKMVGTLVRYFFITVIYNDNGDAGVYSGAGAILMDLYRQGIFTTEPPGLTNRGAETARIAVVVGVIYTVTGVSRYAASFVFSWLCFIGQLLMFRAFRRGVPTGDARRYLVLVMFLPSMLFWPSSIGKEALMVFCIGLASYGAAQLVGSRVRVGGIAMFLLGVAGLFYIRPHMALISITALGFAAAVSTIAGFSATEDKEGKGRAFAIRMVALVVLIGAASVATTQLHSVLGDGTEGAGGIQGVLDKTKAQTGEGGSKFEPVAVTTPLDIPMATITVLFRPFPWESPNLNGLIASSEGALLMVLMVVGRRRVLNWAKSLARYPYLVYCLAFAFTFFIAFSYIGNFGILARQRTQMLPLALTMLAMPALARTQASWFGFHRTRGERKRSRDHQIDTIPRPVPVDVGLQSSAASVPTAIPRGESQL